MTSWTIGHTGRFRAACSERACNKLLPMEYSAQTTRRGQDSCRPSAAPARSR